METHQRGIDDLDRLEFVLEETGTDPVVALQAELDILSGERVAVVEGHALAQLELIREPVCALTPGCGEAGGLRLARHGLHQGIVQGIEKQKRRDLGGFSGL